MSLAAARQVARAGGNAVDVAVAAGLAAMSTEPGIVSLAGGAFVAAWVAGGEPVVIDGNVEMPGRGLGLDRFGRASGRSSRTTAVACACMPGTARWRRPAP